MAILICNDGLIALKSLRSERGGSKKRQESGWKMSGTLTISRKIHRIKTKLNHMALKILSGGFILEKSKSANMRGSSYEFLIFLNK